MAKEKIEIQEFKNLLKNLVKEEISKLKEEDLKEYSDLQELSEKSPKGWQGTTRAMKKHSDKIDNPWALSNYMKSKGAEPHYVDKKGQPNKKEEFKEYFEMNESNNDDYDDFIPGASAWGHSGEWSDYFDDDKESGQYENMTLKQLADEGFSDEEILELLKKQKGLQEAVAIKKKLLVLENRKNIIEKIIQKNNLMNEGFFDSFKKNQGKVEDRNVVDKDLQIAQKALIKAKGFSNTKDLNTYDVIVTKLVKYLSSLDKEGEEATFNKVLETLRSYYKYLKNEKNSIETYMKMLFKDLEEKGFDKSYMTTPNIQKRNIVEPEPAKEQPSVEPKKSSLIDKTIGMAKDLTKMPGLKEDKIKILQKRKKLIEKILKEKSTLNEGFFDKFRKVDPSVEMDDPAMIRKNIDNSIEKANKYSDDFTSNILKASTKINAYYDAMKDVLDKSRLVKGTDKEYENKILDVVSKFYDNLRDQKDMIETYMSRLSSDTLKKKTGEEPDLSAAGYDRRKVLAKKKSDWKDAPLPGHEDDFGGEKKKDKNLIDKTVDMVKGLGKSTSSIKENKNTKSKKK